MMVTAGEGVGVLVGAAITSGWEKKGRGGGVDASLSTRRGRRALSLPPGASPRLPSRSPRSQWQCVELKGNGKMVSFGGWEG